MCPHGWSYRRRYEIHLLMHKMSSDAQCITMEINTKFHTHDEMVEQMSKLTEKKIAPSFGLLPPFDTDCGRNKGLGQ